MAIIGPGSNRCLRQEEVNPREALDGISQSLAGSRDLLCAQADMIRVLQEIFKHRHGLCQHRFVVLSCAGQCLDGPVNRVSGE